MNSLSINQGDVLLLELPFSDFSGSKKRPILVISGRTFNKKYLEFGKLKKKELYRH